MSNEQGYVYVLRFEKPLGSAKHQAQTYIGWAKDVDLRISQHRAGQGAAITRAAAQQGIHMEPIIILRGTRSLERQLKNMKSSTRVIRAYQSSSENIINV